MSEFDSVFDEFAVSDEAHHEPYLPPPLLPMALDALHLVAAGRKVDQFLATVNAKHGGFVTKPRFVEFCRELGDGAPTREDLYEAFKALDVDGSGYLDREEFVNAMCSGEGGMSRAEALAVLVEFDKDGNGTIDADEFIAVVYSQLSARSEKPGARKGVKTAAEVALEAAERNRQAKMAARRAARLEADRVAADPLYLAQKTFLQTIQELALAEEDEFDALLDLEFESRPDRRPPPPPPAFSGADESRRRERQRKQEAEGGCCVVS